MVIRGGALDESVPAPPPESPEFGDWLRRTVSRADLEALPDDDLEALSRFGVRRHWQPGSTLFRQGEEASVLFVIVEGEVELRYERKHDRLIIAIVRAGASIGDLPVLLGRPHLYGAVARRETTTLGFSLETVEAMLEIDPRTCFRWLRLLSRRLERGYRRQVESAGRPAAERLAFLLLFESDDTGSPTIRATQQELALTLGIGRQTVSRELGLLERLALVTRERGGVQILDPEKLRAFASR